MKHIFTRIIVLIFALGNFTTETVAQNCGTDGNCGISPDLVARGATYTKWSSERSSLITYVKVKAHIASMPGPGGDAATLQQLQNSLDLANQYFLPGNIQFVLCGQPDIIDDWNLDWYNGPQYINPYHVYGYINITVVYIIMSPSGVSGLGMPDNAIVDGYALNSNVLAHELGHVLGLYHTHESYTFGAELVNGSNCTTAGDLICDTPADPNLGISGMLNTPGCTYIGTVTDANGQPYTPMVNNIMSYAPWHCSDAFTTGQFNVMHFVLDSVKTYLRKPVSPVIITPFPYRLCPYTADINLTAVPSGGTFSGAQVTGNILDPQSGAPTAYTISYIPSSPPEPAQNYIDQYSYNTDVIDTLSDIWQSFTTYETGAMTRIDFLIRNISSNNFTFKLFSGTGNAGTLLYTSSVTIPSMTSAAWVQFPIGTAINPSVGTVYTAEIISASPGFEYFQNNGWNPTWFDNYQHGQSNINLKDVAFREWINGVPGCQDAYRYYDVYVPPDGTILNISSAYCIAEDTVLLKGDQTNGVIQIDANPASIIIPSAMTVGAHQVLYISSAYGCVDTTAYTSYIVNGQANYTNLVQPVCVNYPSYALSIDPPGGVNWIDSVPGNVFDAGALGAGPHYLEYYNTTLHDTVTFPEQECCTTGNYYNYNMEVDSLNWQSFKANQSGILSGLKTLYYCVSDTFTYETTFIKGSGLNGIVLIHDTVQLPLNNTGWFWIDIFDPNSTAIIEDDSMYTFTIKRLPLGNLTNFGMLESRASDPYPAGNSNGDPASIFTRDFYFRETLTQFHGCDVSAFDTVQVDICTGMDASIENNISVFPNPTGDEIHVRLKNSTSTIVDISITDLPGQVVAEKKVNADGNRETLIDLSGIAPGIYFVNVRTADSYFTKKIIVQR